jgi:hypothetical protein
MIFQIGQLEERFSDLQNYVRSIDTNLFLEGRQLAVTTRQNISPDLAPHDGLTNFGVSTFADWVTNELTYSYISPLFEKTVLDEIITFCKTLTPFRIGRVRLLRLTGRSCYSFHQDLDLRIQIPVFTSEESLFFVGKSEIFHLPANGSIFLLNAREPHTAINGHADNDRIHLVMSLIAKNEDDYNKFLLNNNFVRAPYPQKLAKIYEPTMKRLFSEN